MNGVLDDGDMLGHLLALIVRAGRRPIDAGLRVQVAIRYSQLGVEVIADDWRRRGGQQRRGRFSGGRDWRAWDSRLFPSGSDGDHRSPSKLEALVEEARSKGPGSIGSEGFTGTEELSAGPSTVEVIRLDSAGLLDSSVPPLSFERPANWSSLPTVGAAHFREMLDPSLVLSSIEPTGAVAQGAWAVFEGRPRVADMAHGYFAAIVHTYGDHWTATVDRTTGVIWRCRTELEGALLSSFELSEI